MKKLLTGLSAFLLLVHSMYLLLTERSLILHLELHFLFGVVFLLLECS